MQKRTSLREANSNCELFRSESTRFGSFLGGGSATGDVSSFFQDLLQLIAGLPKSTSLPQLSPAPSSKCRPCRSNHSAVLPPNCLLQVNDLTKTCFFYSWSPYMTRLNSIIKSMCNCASNIVQISHARSKYKYRSSAAVPSDHVTSPQSLLHEESVVDRFIKVADEQLLAMWT